MKQAERGVLDSFLHRYTTVTSHHLRALREGDAPDFAVVDDSGREIGVEVTTAYYTDSTAENLWSRIRGQQPRGYGHAVNPEEALVARIGAILEKKWRRDFGNPCLLLIHIDAPITTSAEFERDVLPEIAVPEGRSPFREVYARLNGDWWQLYPTKGRF